MRKNLTTLLQKGNLTPKERVLLFVANEASKERDGKSILTEADKHALIDDWTAKDNDEVKEYNRFNEGWRLAIFASMDAQTAYLQTRTEHLKKGYVDLQLRLYPFYRDIKYLIKGLEKIKAVDIKEAIEITNKQREQKLKNGLDFDYAVYQLAFESLTKKDQERFIELYQEIEYEHQYLDQEEIIANLFNGKNELTKEAKEKLAELVAENCYNGFAREYQLYHYFACIPLAEVARRFLISKGVKVKGKPLAKNQETDDEDSKTHEVIQKVIEDYARDNKITIEAILKEACLKWLDEDLLEQYTPLVISNGKELFNRWLKAKNEARATLQGLIDKDKLKVEEQTIDETGQDIKGSKIKKSLELSAEILNIKPESNTASELDYPPTSDRIITGESLYNFKGDYKFIKEFKERVDEYYANLGLVYADNDPEQKGEHLDQELLITNKNKKGELDISSLFYLTTTKLKGLFEALQFVKETKKNNEVILDFDSEQTKTMFKETRESIIKGYAKLLAFEDIYKRLSKTYNTDLTYMAKKWREGISDFIDEHNEALSTATGHNKEAERKTIKRKETLKMKDDFFINKDKILPDTDAVESYLEKFENTLGDDF